VARSDLEAPFAQLSPIQFEVAQGDGEATSMSGGTGEVAPIEEPGQPVHHLRVNNSFLATHERNALRWLAARTPSAVTPDHLTLLGLVGAFLAAPMMAVIKIILERNPTTRPLADVLGGDLGTLRVPGVVDAAPAGAKDRIATDE